MLDDSGENNASFHIRVHNISVLPIPNLVSAAAVLALSAALPSFKTIAASSYRAQHINLEEGAALFPGQES